MDEALLERLITEATAVQKIFLGYIDQGENDPWVDLNTDVKNVTLFARVVEGTPIRCVKASGDVKCNSFKLYDHVWNQTEADKQKKESRLKTDKVLHSWEKEDIRYQLRMQEYSLPWPLSNRETLSIRVGWSPTPTAFAQVEVSTVSEAHLKTRSSPVRAHIHCAGYWYDQIDDVTAHCKYITHVDANGSIPKAVLSFGESRVADRIETFRTQTEEHQLH